MVPSERYAEMLKCLHKAKQKPIDNTDSQNDDSGQEEGHGTSHTGIGMDKSGQEGYGDSVGHAVIGRAEIDKTCFPRRKERIIWKK